MKRTLILDALVEFPTAKPRCTISKTDLSKAINYLRQAGIFYELHSERIQDRDHARLLRNLARKFEAMRRKTFPQCSDTPSN